MRNKIYNALLNWIGYNYGSQEMEEPSYNIEEIIDSIVMPIIKEDKDIVIKCIKDFLCTEEYIKLDGEAIAENYRKLLNILEGGDE